MVKINMNVSYIYNNNVIIIILLFSVTFSKNIVLRPLPLTKFYMTLSSHQNVFFYYDLLHFTLFNFNFIYIYIRLSIIQER